VRELSCDLFSNFGTPFVSLEWIVRDFKFGVQIDCQAYKLKTAKLGQKGAGLRHVTYFYNWVHPTTALERQNLQTSYVVHRLTTRGAIQKVQKLGQVYACIKLCDLFFEFWDPLYISGTDKAGDFKFGSRFIARPTKQKMQKYVKRGRVLRHMTYFYNFCNCTTSVKWLNFQTSSLVHRLTTKGTIQKCKN